MERLRENKSKSFEFKRIGNCYGILVKNRVQVLIGPHWPLMLCMIPLFIVLLLSYISIFESKMQKNWSLSGIFVILLAFFSYLITALKDPGLVLSEKISPLDQDVTGRTSYCQTCMIFTGPCIDHCELCGICLENLDHHCIFTGKCIAKNNVLSFYILLSSVFCFFIHSILWYFSHS